MFRFSPNPNSAHRIHWREWGADAFERARTEGKPVMLCLVAFWCGICQRMDETTFSDTEVIALLNAYFVPVRVEDAQRPDIDVRYNRVTLTLSTHDAGGVTDKDFALAAQIDQR